MVVMEEGVFPGDRAIGSSIEIEEERRVAYVGMTRAKERLYLSYALKRMLYGSIRQNRPSRFVMESKMGEDVEKVSSDLIFEDHLLNVGDKVSHQVFGEGVVVQVNQEVAKIAFGFPHGVKNILESHPSIKKLKK